MATENTRIAILGGRGMLGSDLAPACGQQGFDPIVLDLPEFDITNADHVRRAVSSAEAIVNCAAYTNVDGAESEAKSAYRINAEAVGRLGAIARDAGKWLLHVSTDFVFDGRSDRPYIETDPPNPVNTYGKSKLAGEQLLATSGWRYCILRVEWTYGLAGNNFVTKLLQRARAAQALKVVDDQVGSPTATTEVSRAICELLRTRPEGLFHFAAAGYVSRHEMAKFIMDKLSIDINVLPCKTSDFPSPAMRPLNSRFDCSKIQALLSERIESWQMPLERFLRQL
ncbi:MAG: dTDP-4-dehydrorhamnose reductase [Planctomycetes bacterium RBG_16_55_9]|nr:MAG: dTDP-4-dehydrorhamnose reductase [Planctomycetes bacterium RBG_16_55_9]